MPLKYHVDFSLMNFLFSIGSFLHRFKEHLQLTYSLRSGSGQYRDIHQLIRVGPPNRTIIP